MSDPDYEDINSTSDSDTGSEYDYESETDSEAVSVPTTFHLSFLKNYRFRSLQQCKTMWPKRHQP